MGYKICCKNGGGGGKIDEIEETESKRDKKGKGKQERI